MRANDTKNPAHQPREVFRVRTIELILSVTVLNVWPGAMIGGADGTWDCASEATSITQFVVHVAHSGQVCGAGSRVELAE